MARGYINIPKFKHPSSHRPVNQPAYRPNHLSTHRPNHLSTHRPNHPTSGILGNQDGGAGLKALFILGMTGLGAGVGEAMVSSALDAEGVKENLEYLEAQDSSAHLMARMKPDAVGGSAGLVLSIVLLAFKGLVTRGKVKPPQIPVPVRDPSPSDVHEQVTEELTSLEALPTSATVDGLPASLTTEAMEGTPFGMGNDIYIRTKQIGSGGMGEIYKARKLGLEYKPLDEYIVLKKMREEVMGSESNVARFKREAAFIRELSKAPGLQNMEGAGISKFLGFLEDKKGVLWMASEFIDGHDLSEIVKSNISKGNESYDFNEAVNTILYLIQILKICWDFKGKNLVHRDLKPENIRVSNDGWVYLLDFGIATYLQGPDARLTRPDGFVGTLLYSPPETFNPRLRKFDNPAQAFRRDMFALGGILFYLLSGRPPIRGKVSEVIAQLTDDNYKGPDLGLLSAKVRSHPKYPLLEGIIKRATAPNPRDRYVSYDDMYAALYQLIS